MRNNMRNNSLIRLAHYSAPSDDKSISVSGNMENALLMDSSTPYNLTYSLGRQLLVDPDTVFKVKKQELCSIQHCSECNACHYYSYGYNGIQRCNSIKKQSSKNN